MLNHDPQLYRGTQNQWSESESRGLGIIAFPMVALVGAMSILSSCFVPHGALPVHTNVRIFHHVISASEEATEMSELEAAAERVRMAASKFGATQERAAVDWVTKAVDLDPDVSRNADSLLSTQLALFEECLLDDADGKCAALDEALIDLESNLGKAKGTFMQRNQFERAGSRLKAAAAKFGPEQTKAAALWIRRTRSGEASQEGMSLLEQQVALFGECLLEDGSGGSKKCQELEAALAALLEALDAEEKQVGRWVSE